MMAFLFLRSGLQRFRERFGGVAVNLLRSSFGPRRATALVLR